MRTHTIGILFVVAACGGGGASAVEDYEGTAKVGGSDAKITGCKARKIEGHPAVVFTLDSDHTVVISALEGVMMAKGSAEPKKVECITNNQGSGTSGAAGDGVWVTGEGVKLACSLDGAEVKLEVAKYDCGAKNRPSNRKEDEKK
jgi:hypothetical protein